MIQFTIGYCNIDTTVQTLKNFSHDTYHRYHKSSRLKHLVLDDERYPSLKITDDIFSLQIWIKTSYGEEQRMYLDGIVSLNKITINSISFEGIQFNEETFIEFDKVLKGLSEIGKGYIYAEFQQYPIRYEKGRKIEYPSLIEEIYNSLTEEKKEKHKLLYDILQSGYSNLDTY